jgi:hypothetical protein
VQMGRSTGIGNTKRCGVSADLFPIAGRKGIRDSYPRARTAEPPRQRVFVSYARKDATDLALRLRKDPRSNSCEVWLDTARIPGGASRSLLYDWTRFGWARINVAATPGETLLLFGALIGGGS